MAISTNDNIAMRDSVNNTPNINKAMHTFVVMRVRLLFSHRYIMLAIPMSKILPKWFD